MLYAKRGDAVRRGYGQSPEVFFGVDTPSGGAEPGTSAGIKYEAYEVP
jgi:hypothetical protein